MPRAGFFPFLWVLGGGTSCTPPLGRRSCLVTMTTPIPGAGAAGPVPSGQAHAVALHPRGSPWAAVSVWFAAGETSLGDPRRTNNDHHGDPSASVKNSSRAEQGLCRLQISDLTPPRAPQSTRVTAVAPADREPV